MNCFVFSLGLFPSALAAANHLPPSHPLILCIFFSHTDQRRALFHHTHESPRWSPSRPPARTSLRGVKMLPSCRGRRLRPPQNNLYFNIFNQHVRFCDRGNFLLKSYVSSHNTDVARRMLSKVFSPPLLVKQEELDLGRCLCISLVNFEHCGREKGKCDGGSRPQQQCDVKHLLQKGGNQCNMRKLQNEASFNLPIHVLSTGRCQQVVTELCSRPETVLANLNSNISAKSQPVVLDLSLHFDTELIGQPCLPEWSTNEYMRVLIAAC